MPSPGKFCMVVETFVRGDLKFETRYFVIRSNTGGFLVGEKTPPWICSQKEPYFDNHANLPGKAMKLRPRPHPTPRKQACH